ncbi:MAG TPA: carboxypeptidase regulatory-like domain-containing protein [Bryobacteraceae bacterium]|nr:carboxypeptidase regulatory-like domain-containing protein [Bryobacteraceae bacterium]
MSRLGALFLPLAIAAFGQTGGVGGTVTDASGAPVGGVLVRVVRDGGELETTATSDAVGAYRFGGLAPGAYELRVNREGFLPFRRGGVPVAAGGRASVDIQLLVEPRHEAITVVESAVQVETAGGQLSAALSASQLSAVPVNGRSYTDLLSLAPGVAPFSSQQPNAVVMSGCTSAPPSGDLNPGNLSVGGQRETANAFVVNGSSAQEDFNMGAAMVPNLDSILELHVLTGTFDAERGNFSGGQVLVTTKSGTDQWHGSAFEYLRNTDLDARNYFAPERAAYGRNQFGGTLGGPLRANRVFLFADYQGTRMTEGIETGRIAVPSVAERSGDFSDAAGDLTGKVNGSYWAGLLAQKLDYGVAAGEPYYFPGCASPSDCVFPGAQIPQRAWSAPAKALLPYIPQPNVGTGIFSSASGNETLRDDKGSVRIDANTRWGALSGYYSGDDYGLNNPYPTGQGGANVPGFSAISLGRAQLATIALTTAGAQTVNELRVGYLRDAGNIGQPAGGVGPTLASQGFVDGSGKPGIVPLAPQYEGIENVAFNDFTIGDTITGVDQANNTYQWSDGFSRAIGKHMFKTGAEIHQDQVNINPDATYNGSFLFQGTETGSDFADFLLGVASSYAQGDSRAFYLRNRYAGIYAQDSWQVHPNLTINYGLRWDLLPPWREKYNQLQTMVPGQQSVVYPGAPEGLVFPGDPGIPDTLAPARYTNFAPRLGLAYSPNATSGILGKLFGPSGATSLRAGYGVYYTAIEGLSAGIMSANPPYGYDYTSLAPPLFATPFVTAATGQDVGQRFPSPIPDAAATASHPNAAIDWPQYLPVTGVPSFFHRNVTPYSESYTVSVERQLAKGTVLSASYAGSQSHHLLVLISANPGNPALCLSLSQPQDVMPGSAVCGPFGESGTYVTPAGETIDGTRGPFSSQFAAVTYQKTMGNSSYHSLQTSLRHAGAHGQAAISYTYGKSLDQSSSLAEPVNPVNPRLSNALSAFDMRHNFVASYEWIVPAVRVRGHGGQWLQGWAISGVARFTTGLPVTLVNNDDTSLLGSIPNGINNNGVDTPDYQPGDLQVNNNPRSGRPAFNTALFTLPALGQLGTAARRFFYGPGMANWDAALRKTVRLEEGRSVEFRLEAFNLLNHAQFYGPAAVDGNISSANFGQIGAAAPPRLVEIAVRFGF